MLWGMMGARVSRCVGDGGRDHKRLRGRDHPQTISERVGGCVVNGFDQPLGRSSDRHSAILQPTDRVVQPVIAPEYFPDDDGARGSEEVERTGLVRRGLMGVADFDRIGFGDDALGILPDLLERR